MLVCQTISQNVTGGERGLKDCPHVLVKRAVAYKIQLITQYSDAANPDLFDCTFFIAIFYRCLSSTTDSLPLLFIDITIPRKYLPGLLASLGAAAPPRPPPEEDIATPLEGMWPGRSLRAVLREERDTRTRLCLLPQSEVISMHSGDVDRRSPLGDIRPPAGL